MRHSHSEIWTHLVFSTKGHKPSIDSLKVDIIKQGLGDFIASIPDQHGTFCVLVDHFHMLIKLPENLSVNQLAEQIQELISQRLRQEGFDPDTLEWESDYHAHSVSLNRLSVEKSLIERQDIKHKEISLKEELKFLGL
ncbi:MAG TPA: transposase [Algoriphagus sp.]|jgi:putative transposase|uniref:transposase n=1 Tax=Algoriphagus TaxID=246875 RepID=UPI000C4B01FF|nr:MULTISPECIES: transposase [Algoriphagus]MAL13923.1 transposase [Algoriphagus sp.]MAN86932.1 transposase [Algoriphagus sp.]QYH37281.1 transposase [Algoriphagus sp. NBT04N3]HAD52789.1 transposase [Algoriphagus sp.]HAH35411.1 transposase [Algoriphagus sp.]|tara:strand:+ start:2003 stop:2416 length:414 start_codon:yes stop_codon:yes gene_type:complete